MYYLWNDVEKKTITFSHVSLAHITNIYQMASSIAIEKTNGRDNGTRKGSVISNSYRCILYDNIRGVYRRNPS